MRKFLMLAFLLSGAGLIAQDEETITYYCLVETFNEKNKYETQKIEVPLEYPVPVEAGFKKFKQVVSISIFNYGASLYIARSEDAEDNYLHSYFSFDDPPRNFSLQTDHWDEGITFQCECDQSGYPEEE